MEPFNDWVPPGLLSLDRMLAGNFIPPISFLFSRRAYEELGSVYEIIPYLGDWGFLIRFLCRYDVYLVPQFLAFYHWRIRSSSGGFSNSVTSELDRHRFYKQFLLNAWLREDFAVRKGGSGNLRQSAGSDPDAARESTSSGRPRSRPRLGLQGRPRRLWTTIGSPRPGERYGRSGPP